MRAILLLISVLLLSNFSFGQGLTAVLRTNTNTVTAKKLVGRELVIPIDLNIINSTANPIVANVGIIIRNEAPSSMRLQPTGLPGPNDLALSTQPGFPTTIAVNVLALQTAQAAVYIIFPTTAIINQEKMIFADLIINGQVVNTIQVYIIPDDSNNIFDRDTYIDNRSNRLDFVAEVKQEKNRLILSGTKDETSASRIVILEPDESLAIWNLDLVSFKRSEVVDKFSYFTIPFKVRRQIDNIPRTAQSGITNLGINLDLFQLRLDKYIAKGTKATHKFSCGVWIAPSVEELDSIQTRGYHGKLAGKFEKSKQLFVSAGLTISYSYNDLSFVFVPMGFDFATSSIGHEWIYRNRRWWGFGIGISPKFLSGLFKKE